MFKYSNAKDRKAIQQKEKVLKVFYLILVAVMVATSILNELRHISWLGNIGWIKTMDYKDMNVTRDFMLIGLLVFTYLLLTYCLYRYYYYDFIE